MFNKSLKLVRGSIKSSKAWSMDSLNQHALHTDHHVIDARFRCLDTVARKRISLLCFPIISALILANIEPQLSKLQAPSKLDKSLIFLNFEAHFKIL
ncbi:CLUMA_CG008862, isoform A [Clunio marinus]|uniref:CLUMA_CG008862, isoform A n=1 Tax=Clunio marinus TaxID=568069 RepID=A0A1J1I6Y3_9DIPT|nr:CLUMA_CG008862, isoform A [Clunio marinus]